MKDCVSNKPQNHFPLTQNVRHFMRCIEWALIGIMCAGACISSLAIYGAYRLLKG